MSESEAAAFADLEAAAAPLEPGPDQRAALMAMVVDHTEAFLAGLPEGPANRRWDEAFETLDPEFVEQGRDPHEVLAWLGRSVEGPGMTSASPRFMGYVPGGGLFHSALGDFIAATSNKYAGFASAAPGAVRLENATAAWLARVIGFPASAAGTLTSGGSLANLTAIVTAREALDEAGGGAIYLAASAPGSSGAAAASSAASSSRMASSIKRRAAGPHARHDR
jgi:hypothetical protein